ncbi:DUF3247 family protein [Lysobacter sp. cf310]|uniref:DUF3247 family protein n=1 Tax=Lysobacter sp. cf310 TaxID=1761790 RepID=UPI0008EA6ED1|nr:DUF3247 family protein [Lysobacter sp. cf310]SFL19435.1 Protein of unknown function [Lysobacter sp. cf310]
MSRNADHVYTAPADIARLEARIAGLHDDARVELRLRDGRVLAGVVAALPTLQSFYGPGDEEGLNGVLRLEQAGGTQDLWLDEIDAIRPLTEAELERFQRDLPH